MCTISLSSYMIPFQKQQIQVVTGSHFGENQSDLPFNTFCFLSCYPCNIFIWRFKIIIENSYSVCAFFVSKVDLDDQKNYRMHILLLSFRQFSRKHPRIFPLCFELLYMICISTMMKISEI